MTDPLLSVVMPVHGGGAWLDLALASVRSECPGDVEVVIRDSTPDRSRADVVERHARRLRIDYAYMPDVASWTRKTNLAVEAAHGTHICMLHQDDLWLEDRIGAARALIDRFPHASLLLTPCLLVDNGGRKRGEWHPPFPAGKVPSEMFRDRLLVQNSIAVPAPVFRRDAYLAVGGLDETLWYTPDWDLWLKLGDHGGVVYDPRPATAFRIHGGSLTMSGDRQEFGQQLDLVLSRHLSAGSRYARLSRASARINTLLSQAAQHDWRALVRALGTLVALGPIDAARYLKYSRIVERTLPRLRLRLAGVI